MEKLLNTVARWGVVPVCAFASALFLSAGIAVAADQERTQEQGKSQVQAQEQIYGSQLMTDKERTEYQAKMHAAKTDEEREKIRKVHHEQMKARAAERGMKLPDEPPMKGGGMGMGPGPGAGHGDPD